MIRLCQESVEHGPEFAPAHALLALAWSDKGELELAVEECRTAEALDLTDFIVIYSVSLVYLRSGMIEELRGFQQRIEPFVDELIPSAQAHLACYRGYFRHIEGKYAEAIKECELSLELDPIGEWAARNIGYVHLEQGEYGRAAEWFRKAIEIAPTRSRLDEVYALLAETLEKLGSPDEAVRVSCKAISTDPRDRSAHQNLIGLLRRHREKAVVEELVSLVDELEGARERWGNDHLVPRTLAFLRLRVPGLRNVEKARELISLAANAAPGKEAELLAVLAEVQHAEGSPAAAIATLEEALRLPDASTWHAALLREYRSEVSSDVSSSKFDEAASQLGHPEESQETTTPEPVEILRINCGAAKEYRDTSGKVWGPDRWFRGGRPGGRRVITKTDDPALYESYRKFERDQYRPGYRIPLPDGRYRLTLHFMKERAAEKDAAAGEVLVEGQSFTRRRHGYMFWWAAAEAVPGVVIVEGGALEIELDTSAGRPHIAAIEIEALR